MLRNPSDLAEGFKVNCYFQPGRAVGGEWLWLTARCNFPVPDENLLWGVASGAGAGGIPRGLVAACIAGCGVAALCFPWIRAAPVGHARIRCFSGAIPGANPVRNPLNLTLTCWTHVCFFASSISGFMKTNKLFLASWRPLKKHTSSKTGWPAIILHGVLPSLPSGLGLWGSGGPGRFRAGDHRRIRPAGWLGGQGMSREAQGRAPSPVQFHGRHREPRTANKSRPNNARHMKSQAPDPSAFLLIRTHADLHAIFHPVCCA